MIDWDLLQAMFKLVIMIVTMISVPAFSLGALWCGCKGRYPEACYWMGWAIFCKV